MIRNWNRIKFEFCFHCWCRGRCRRHRHHHCYYGCCCLYGKTKYATEMYMWQYTPSPHVIPIAPLLFWNEAAKMPETSTFTHSYCIFDERYVIVYVCMNLFMCLYILYILLTNEIIVNATVRLYVCRYGHNSRFDFFFASNNNQNYDYTFCHYSFPCLFHCTIYILR